METRRAQRPPWAAVVVFALLGSGMASQVNLQRRLSAGGRVDEARAEQALNRYADVKTENENLRQRIAELNTQLREAQRNQAAGERVEGVRKDLEAARRLAGLTSLRGPGIRLTIRDAAAPVELDLNQNPYTVHDQDLLLVVNELWAARAEAIAINSERLVTNSEIRCTGPTILINGFSLALPYEVRAIGDPDALTSALVDLRGGVVDQLRNAGIEVKVVKERDVQVPALAHEPAFRYALPAPNGTGESDGA